MVHALKINTKGDVAATNIGAATELTMEAAQQFFGKKTEPAIMGQYNYKTLTVYIVGYAKGRAGTENKTAWPKPNDKAVLFGDVLLVASSNKEKAKESITDLASLTREDFKELSAEPELAPDNVSTKDEDDDEELPEFGEDEEDEEEEDEQENEDEDEVEVEVEDELPEEEVEEAPVPKRKKKATPTAILSGYQKQSLLIVNEGHDELHAESPADVPDRLNCRLRFGFIEDITGLNPEDLDREIFLATLEEATKKRIFAHWKNPLFNEIYGYRQFRLFSNLHPKSPVGNARLVERIREGELTAAALARLDDMELYPENWKKLQDQQQAKELRLLEGNKMAATDMFKCNRCGKRETTYYEMQTRSADEPMTTYVQCIPCGNKWKC